MRLLGGGVLALFVHHHQPSSYIAYTRKKTRLHGINEWRDQAIESKYTLDSYKPPQQQSTNNDNPTITTPSKVPILPFPFSDILLLGQRTQLNLYEQRFHELFNDAITNHCGIIAQGLLAGNGMITTLPLCEIESYTRLGAKDNWKYTGNGMGNGCIFVTIRAVSRAKIVESDLLQEGPYMIARVVELVDDELSSEESVIGESSQLAVANLVASNIENLMVSLASMEHKLKVVEEEKRYQEGKKTNNDESRREVVKDDSDEGIMSRRIINAQLESLFMQDSNEGVDVPSSGQEEEEDDAIEDTEDEDDGNALPDDSDEDIDRVAQFAAAFESAKEADTFGYIMPSTLAVPDNLLSKAGGSSKQTTIRNSKDLVGISWAAFCTGDKNNLQRDVIKIQALDMTNILKRLQLAASMLLEEKKRLKAKLALAGITDPGNTESSTD
jgi:Lon protease-like protein